jgi:hypothetical protein
LRAEINGIRARRDRRLQSGGRACGREKFRFHIKNQTVWRKKAKNLPFPSRKLSLSIEFTRKKAYNEKAGVSYAPSV